MYYNINIKPDDITLAFLIQDAEYFGWKKKDILDHVAVTLMSKGQEYAGGSDDRLHNLKLSQLVSENTALKCLYGFQLKHIVSIIDIIRADGGEGDTNIELVKEKFGDAICYEILKKALWIDTYGE